MTRCVWCDLGENHVWHDNGELVVDYEFSSVTGKGPVAVTGPGGSFVVGDGTEIELKGDTVIVISPIVLFVAGFLIGSICAVIGYFIGVTMYVGRHER